ncbi:MAG TPA: hypothetical protein VLQ89_00640 [Candidatus Binatia bacterium]|nr:hypothetical protein [Candidatus Binatia bacterium]
MKKFIKPAVFGVILITCLFVISTGCKKKAECSADEYLCGNITFQACCTETDCYYLVDGEKYNCNGVDCQAAAYQIVLTYCGGLTNYSEKQLLSTVERVLDAVK